MPKQGKTPKKKSKEKTPQKSGESEYPAMDEDEYNRLFQNAIEYAQAQLEQKHADHIKALEADREAKIKVVEDRLTLKVFHQRPSSSFKRFRCFRSGVPVGRRRLALVRAGRTVTQASRRLRG